MEGALHKNIIITMRESRRGRIDSFHSLERISLQHDIGLFELGVSLDLIGVELEQFTHHGDIVCLESHRV